MNKQEFTNALKARLSALPKQEVEERISFFSEMIDDRIEDGLSEEEAIRDIGAVDDIALQIADEIPLSKIINNKFKTRKKRSTWEITLLIVGAPIWGSLLISALAVVFSLYASLWSIVVSLWASELSFVVSAPVGLLAGIVLICKGEFSMGLLGIASGLVLAGLAILFFFVCKPATKGMIFLTKKIISAIKHCFVRKEK